MADKPQSNDSSATLRVPVCVAAASATALVAWALAFTAVVLNMTIQAVVVFASVATVAGCGILAAVVVVSFRRACRTLQAVQAKKFNQQMRQLSEDMIASFGALRAEIMEQHRQTRIAQFAAVPEAANGTHLRPVK